MGINFGDKLSQDDLNRVKDIHNPPEFDPDFSGGGDSGGGFDGFFDDLGSFGQDDSSDGGFGGFGGDSGGSGGFNSSGGSSGFGGQDSFSGFGNNQGGFGNNSGGFGNNSGGFGNNQGGFGNNQGGFGNGFGGAFGGAFGQNQQTQQVENKPGVLDKAFDASVDASIGLGKLLVEFVKSIKNRNADDFGYFSRNMIIVGGIMFLASLFVAILGSIMKISFMNFSGVPIQFLVAGIISVGTGLAGLSFSAMKIANSDGEVETSIQELPDVSATMEDDSTSDYEDNIGDIMDDLFGDSGDDDMSGLLDDGFESSDNMLSDDEEPDFGDPVKMDFNSVLQDVQENRYLSRETLFNTFKALMPLNTPQFADKSELSADDTLYQQIETLTLKAMSNVLKCELEDVKSNMVSCEDTFFSYQYKMKRIKGLNKVDELAREIEVYARDNSEDNSKTATVSIEQDNYKIILTKGEDAIVTFGDLFKQKYVCDFILNEKNKLPIITGISELGDVILHDAKLFDTMLIAGKPRSGKSWYVLSILLMLALFNTPEDVQFIVVDPKESNLFNTFALLPHVIGLHNESRILEIMDDIIVNEGGRRKKLLADNKCDDIWALRKKGIKLPVLYLVIDEYITVRNNLGDLSKELDTKLQVIISQLPSQGIRLLFVPHRATGVVNKTNRTMLQFTAAVRADIEDVKDTLGVSKWTRGLTKPGDIAVKTSAEQNPRFVRGAAVTTDDDENAELIKTAAKIFYKMGVDIPKKTMDLAENRDEEKIREELSDDVNRIQYNNWDNTGD